jgi:transcriptional regulator with XRE-family HTH domain
MTTRRRTHRLGERRASRQADGVTGDIIAARAQRGETRDEVAARAGVSPDSVRRVEHGDPHVQLNTLCAVGEAIGVDIVLRAYPGRAPAFRDTGQLGVQGLIRASAHESWHAQVEVRAGDHGEAIDLCLFGPTEILAVEVDRLLLDFQDQYRRNALKREFLTERHRRPVRLVMVTLDTDRNRRAVQPHRTFIESVLPARSREVLASLRTGRPLARDGLLWVRPDRLRRRA